MQDDNPTTSSPTPPAESAGATETTHEPQAEWLEEFYLLSDDDIPGWFGDVFDMGVEVRSFEGGIHVHFCKDDDSFDISETPTMTLYGPRRRVLCDLLRYPLFIQAMCTINFIAEKHPAIVADQLFWRMPMELLYRKRVAEDIEARAKAEEATS